MSAAKQPVWPEYLSGGPAMMQTTHACDTHDTWAAEFCLLAASLGSGPGSTMHFAFEDDLSVCCCVTFAGVTQST